MIHSASSGLFDTEDMVEEGDVFKLWSSLAMI
jgi:hypothetical protein